MFKVNDKVMQNGIEEDLRKMYKLVILKNKYLYMKMINEIYSYLYKRIRYF